MHQRATSRSTFTRRATFAAISLIFSAGATLPTARIRPSQPQWPRSNARAV